MKVLVCGSRKPLHTTKRDVFEYLDYIHSKLQITFLIHGAARGIDTMARDWAIDREIAVRGYPADWKKYGGMAGPIRNSEMLRKEEDIKTVVAFEGGRGTNDMVSKALREGIRVIQHEQRVRRSSI